jgi:hypothetical protein
MSGRHLDRGGNTHANIIVINRLAIADSQLGGSELRDARGIATQRTVRINSGEKSGEPQHETLTFDFSAEGKKNMTPAELAMFQATKTYVLSQQGRAFHLPTARDPKITKPSAAVLTTPQELANTEEKDQRKKVRVSVLQKRRLFGIAGDLDMPIVVEGVDLIAESKKRKQRPRDKWCGHCLLYKTKACGAKKCLAKTAAVEARFPPPSVAQETTPGMPHPTNPPSPPFGPPNKTRTRGKDQPVILDFQDNDGTIPNLNIGVVTEATGTFATKATPTGSPMKRLLLTNDAPAPAQPKKKRKLKQCPPVRPFCMP